MPIPQHCLRQLSQEEREVARQVYAKMAGAYTDATAQADEPKVLVRNRFVDCEILEVLRILKQDTRLLVAAWQVWVKGRDLHYLNYPVSKFREELDGVLAVAHSEIAAQDAQARRVRR